MTDRAALLITAMILETIADLILLIGTIYLCAFQHWTLWTIAAALIISAQISLSLDKKMGFVD